MALVGPAPLLLPDLLLRLRAGLGLPRAPVIVVPAPLVAAAASLATLLPGALLDRDTLAMLARGNAADATATSKLLGRAPRGVDAFIPPRDAPTTRAAARLTWLLPLLRGSVAIVWLVTGIVSLWVYPVADSYALLARTGVPAALAPAALSARPARPRVRLARADAARYARRWLWRAQAALILCYSSMIAWRLPEFWLAPVRAAAEERAAARVAGGARRARTRRCARERRGPR